jgi:hypothetical protein
MKTSISLRFALFILPVFSLLSCTGSTEITQSWRNPDIQPVIFDKVLVIGMSDDAIARGNVEQAVVKELRAAGVTAQMGMEVFPPMLFKEKMDREKAKARIAGAGADAVLLLTLLDNRTTETYIPGAMVYTPSAGSMAMYGYWYDSWNVAYTQGYYMNSKEIVVQSNLYRTSDEALLWAGKSAATDPSSMSKFARLFSKVVVRQMITDGVFAARSDTK